ncbi:secreted RxLR effector protein 161-like [Humulus lupulus]|uniref:secreted RxLR effector protein 161-like n=1 Tax=Humulus lupulus TaxID=3486 RepID=UPI002B409A31|nr:secreted RxLR effector protein 161-like [Humulus lupulus]
MVCTRPDLCHAVSVVSMYMGNPCSEYWEAVKWIMRYFNGTANLGLLYSTKSSKPEAYGYVDADYAGDLDTKRSQTSFVFKLNNYTISWKANLQSIVALSIFESEYIACTEAVKEALWLKGLTRELGVDQRVVTIFSDSQSALHLSKNQVFHERIKHIDVRLHFIRDVIAEGKVKLEKPAPEEYIIMIIIFLKADLRELKESRESERTEKNKRES